MTSSLTPFPRPSARETKRGETPTTTAPLALVQRPRRNRKADWSRRLIREHELTVDDLIWPLFLIEGTSRREPVGSMPGVERLTIDEAVREAERAAKLRIPALAVFPNTDPSLRDPRGSDALNRQNLVCRTVRAIKTAVPEIGVVTDVALDPYTAHGHDGLVDERGCVINDSTSAILVEQALVQAAAGADIVAPSDMMDGRVGRIREVLDEGGYSHVAIMAYAAKYCSAFYGPFREAAESAPAFGDRRSHQMDPANVEEALREVALDLDEGADIVMVKPALPYLDVIARVKEETGYPLAAYQVSGEYAMIKAAAERGWVDGERAMMESLLAIRRAGADFTLTYFATEAATLLASGWE